MGGGSWFLSSSSGVTFVPMNCPKCVGIDFENKLSTFVFQVVRFEWTWTPSEVNIRKIYLEEVHIRDSDSAKPNQKPRNKIANFKEVKIF